MSPRREEFHAALTGRVRKLVAAGALWALGGALANRRRRRRRIGRAQGLVIDTGALTPFVENMDRSLAFYHDVFDMEVPPLPDIGRPRPYNNPNPRLFAFFDIPGAKERHQSARVKGIRTGIEPMEIQQVPFKTITLRIQDPGNVTIVPGGARHRHDAGEGEGGGVPGGPAGGAPVTPWRRHPRGDRPRRGQPLPRAAPAAVDSCQRAGSQRHGHPRHGDRGRPARTMQVYRDVFGFTVEGETRRSPPTGRRASPACRRPNRGARGPRRATRSCGWSSSSSRASIARR